MPGLLSSPVCLTVIWFLSWSLCSSRAQIRTDEVPDVQYKTLGSNVTLTCGKSQNRLPVVWHLNNSSVLPWHRVTPDGELILPQVDRSAQGDYSCYDTEGRLLHTVTLRLGHRPGLLSISCRVPNHTHVRCSWVEPAKMYLPVSYNATFKNGAEWRPCVVDAARRHCDVDELAFWQPMHTLIVTAFNDFGSSKTTIRIKLHELLKPDPPESVKVEELEDFPQRLLVSWSFPSSWPVEDAFPLMFHIRYRPQGSVYWSEIYTEESSFVILDALAGHLHQVQVRARDEVNSESRWSDWSQLLLVKPWEVYATADPTEESEYFFPFDTKPETSTEKSHNPIQGDEGNLGLVILLVLFSVVILTTILSLIFVMWMRQRRRDQATKQELTSMVKMKSMPI
ncbi:interleukin-11 receptor subunit alpha [Salarias fasciatus]|uniref:Ciliary neurotrophic factor receptor subunit alpha-like n=1 Tax=Salarias fasciatus TaxID=181472 RepID=A0A672J2K1_SALFA|nr:ciliary neurotrophic factor receptor subunit alpha-like [Salarias fasciatus]